MDEKRTVGIMSDVNNDSTQIRMKAYCVKWLWKAGHQRKSYTGLSINNRIHKFYTHANEYEKWNCARKAKDV